jgi:predicted nucleic acid-binding protein
VDEQIVAPELVTYEVANAIWNHEHLLKDIDNGKQYLSIFYGLMDAGKIKILTPNEELMQESFSIAKRQGITLNDAVFISLAIKLGLTLKSYDKVQIRALKSENSRSYDSK